MVPVIRRAARLASFVGGIAAVAALPLLGRAVRAGGADRCALDGVAIEAATRIRIVDPGGRALPFCCVECAQRWLAGTAGSPRGIRVTDETTRAEVPAGEAWFVASRIRAPGASASNIHVFAREADARRHAEAFGGMVLEGDRRPLRAREGAPR